MIALSSFAPFLLLLFLFFLFAQSNSVSLSPFIGPFSSCSNWYMSVPHSAKLDELVELLQTMKKTDKCIVYFLTCAAVTFFEVQPWAPSTFSHERQLLFRLILFFEESEKPRGSRLKYPEYLVVVRQAD